MSDAERQAVTRLLQELHRAASADVGSERVWLLLGFISATAKLSAEDIRMRTGVERIHEHTDRLVERTAELERR